jgi:hypothetical protein
MDEDKMVLNGVREYGESFPVELIRNQDTKGRWCIKAVNFDGAGSTQVDLVDLLELLQNNNITLWELHFGRMKPVSE